MLDLVKKMARNFGLEIRRVPRHSVTGEQQQYPYIESFQMNGISFDYWITDNMYRDWYNPTAQAGWCINEGYVKLVAPDDKVLEVGCNAGFTTCLLSRAVGPNGLVVGLDIIPKNCLLSAAQIGLNAITNTRILNRGAADYPGKIWVTNKNNGSVDTKRSPGAIEVDVVCCDDLIAEYGHFDVIKVDVEGFESQVFKGARKLMEKRPKLLLEVHGSDVEKYGSSYDELFRLISASDYEGFMCLDPNSATSSNQLVPFDREHVLRTKSHGNLFLRARGS
ncbi:MAG: FkbM family methyltransferase [Deltaproteobacteria bacterium]|nr:FkbM family methyltransferase [Deltaproteobacteria bacterium]